MRDILFRGKRIDNGKWVYGDLIQIPCGVKFIVNNKFGACIDERGNFINTEAPFVCEVIPETVGQFTGLYDKNGNKVFEGDIITLEGDINGDVQFVQGVFGVEWYGVKNQGAWGAKHNLRTFEDGANEEFDVIGIIYDNPELLEKKK